MTMKDVFKILPDFDKFWDFSRPVESDATFRALLSTTIHMSIRTMHSSCKLKSRVPKVFNELKREGEWSKAH